MLKTGQARTATYTARLDKAVDQPTLVGNKRKPQYLDVALARGNNDLKSKNLKDSTKNGKGNNVKENFGINRGRNKVNAFSGKADSSGVNNEGKLNTNTSGNKTARSKVGSGAISPEKPHTFKEKLKVESHKKQKLYQELDLMLAGRQQVPYRLENEELEFPVKVTRNEHIQLVTKSSLFPGISQEARARHNENVSHRDSIVPAKTFLGLENKTLHKRELQAQARLDKLDNIDDFSVGDFTVKTNAQGGNIQSSHETANKPQPLSVGIPVHAGITSSRRHIVAEIPVYLPTFAGGNQPVQPVVKESRPISVAKVYETTFPRSTSKPLGGERVSSNHAPEAFVGPVTGLDTVVAETRGGEPVLNTYRSTGNPISERLFQEQAEHERSLLEKDNLKYFDVDPDANHADQTSHSSVRISQESDQKNVTLVSDPGPRRNRIFEEDIDKTRLTPDGYLAQKARQTRLDKEARILRNAEMRSAFIENESVTQISSGTKPIVFDNQYQVDFYAQKTRSGIRRNRNIDREDSWIKSQLEKPFRTPVPMDTHRNQANTHRVGSYGNEMLRDSGQESNRGDGKGTYRVTDPDRSTNMPHRLPDNIRDRDRYNDPPVFKDHERLGRRDYERSPQFEPRNDREQGKFNLDIRERRDYDRTERERQNNERDRRYHERTERDQQTNERDRRDIDRNERDRQNNERDRRELDRNERNRRELSREERGPVPSRFEPDQKEYRKDETAPISSKYETGQHEQRYDSKRFDRSQREPPRVDDVRRYADQRVERDTYKHAEKVEKPSYKSTKRNEKIQYVLRNKSGNLSTELRKSDMSNKSDPLPENVPPSSTEFVRERSSKSLYSNRQSDMDTEPKNAPQSFTRQIGQEKSKISLKEHKDPSERLPTYETKTDKTGRKSTDDLNKYFDEPERPASPSNVIPFYSDNVNTYSKLNHDFRNGELMTPVQEMSIKLSEDDDKDGQMSKTDKGSEKSKPVDPYERSDRIKFLSSNENKHEIKDDRQSPWRKTEEAKGNEASPMLSDVQPKRFTENPDIRNIKGPDSVEQIRERIREKTIEKMKEKPDRRREKTIDSQGPTDNKDEVKSDEFDVDDMNLDDIETEMDANELYLCYLVMDSGEKIGPIRLDINDVQVGLPNPEKLKDLPEETGEVEDEGMRNRQTGSHGLNEFSSRSHSMLMLTIDSEMQDPDDENLYITKRGKLTFVDLAGSEKVKDSGSTADSLVESNSINKSLLVLGNCISSLGDQKRRQGHIPYRDSKLTKLLADSLGGNGVTLMICCVTPSSHHAPETMNTLRYASRAKKIRTKPVIKMDPREKLILSLKREIKVLRNENHYLRQQTGIPTPRPRPRPVFEAFKPNNDVTKSNNDVQKPNYADQKPNNDVHVVKNNAKNKEKLEFPAKPKGQLQKENDQKFVKMIKDTNGKPESNNTVGNNDDKLKQQNGGTADETGLYEMLQEYMVENESLRTENAEMQVNKDKVRQDQQLLYRDNEKLMKRVDDLERRLNQATTSWQSMPRQDSQRSRDQSPRGSPPYNQAGGSGGKVVQAKFAQPPADLPLRDNPALRDPIYPGSPPQGYNSPNSNNGRGRQPPGQPSPVRGQPLKPPHRLADPIPQQRQQYEQNGPPYMNGHPGGHPGVHPGMVPGPGSHPGTGQQYRQYSPSGRQNDVHMDSRKSSTSSSSDAIKDMNEKLKQELMQLDGQIHHHQAYNQYRPNNQYGSQGSMR